MEFESPFAEEVETTSHNTNNYIHGAEELESNGPFSQLNEVLLNENSDQPSTENYWDWDILNIEGYEDPYNSGIRLQKVYDKNIKLSKNFTVGEFAAAEEGKYKWEYYRVDEDLITELQKLRDAIRKPVNIIDGYYPPKYYLSVYKKSLPAANPHFIGRGAKIRISGLSGKEIAEQILRNCDQSVSVSFGDSTAAFYIKHAGPRISSYIRDTKKKDEAIRYLENVDRSVKAGVIEIIDIVQEPIPNALVSLCMPGNDLRITGKEFQESKTIIGEVLTALDKFLLGKSDADNFAAFLKSTKNFPKLSEDILKMNSSADAIKLTEEWNKGSDYLSKVQLLKNSIGLIENIIKISSMTEKKKKYEEFLGSNVGANIYFTIDILEGFTKLTSDVICLGAAIGSVLATDAATKASLLGHAIKVEKFFKPVLYAFEGIKIIRSTVNIVIAIGKGDYQAVSDNLIDISKSLINIAAMAKYGSGFLSVVTLIYVFYKFVNYLAHQLHAIHVNNAQNSTIDALTDLNNKFFLVTKAFLSINLNYEKILRALDYDDSKLSLHSNLQWMAYKDFTYLHQKLDDFSKVVKDFYSTHSRVSLFYSSFFSIPNRIYSEDRTSTLQSIQIVLSNPPSDQESIDFVYIDSVNEYYKFFYEGIVKCNLDIQEIFKERYQVSLKAGAEEQISSETNAEDEFSGENIYSEYESGNLAGSPKAVPINRPISFAPDPLPVCHWPIKTKVKEGKLVSFENADGKMIGNPSRRFLADRTTSSGAGRYHVGIDLYGDFNEEVVACEDGKILSFKHFYTTKGGNPTYTLVVQHPNVVINYGEVGPSSLRRLNLKVGDTVKAGQTIGFIGATNMLHFETYRIGESNSSLPPHRWMKSEPNPPATLLNPTKYLLYLSEKGLGATSSSNISTTQVQNTVLQKDWSDAIRLNRFYGNSLGWNAYAEKINDFLLPYSGMQNVSLGEDLFAQAVSTWQKSKGFTQKDSDGIIGPKTWQVLKGFIQGVVAPQQTPKPPVPVSPSKTPAWVTTLTPLLNKYRGDIPLEFLLGWIAVESFGRIGVTTNLNERGYFQIHPDESKMLKITDHNRLSTDPEFSIMSGIALVRNRGIQAGNIAAALGFEKGSDLYWHIVKLLHWLPGGVKIIVDLMRSEGFKPGSWEEFKSFVVRNKEKIEASMRKAYKKVWDPLKGLNNVDKLYSYVNQFSQSLKQNELMSEYETFATEEEADDGSYESFEPYTNNENDLHDLHDEHDEHLHEQESYDGDVNFEEFVEPVTEHGYEATADYNSESSDENYAEQFLYNYENDLNETDAVISNELDEHELTENAIIPGYQKFIDEVNFLVKDWSKAIRLNRSYGNSLGWNAYVQKINDLLLPYSGYQSVSLGEEAFAQAVSNWQSKQGMSAKDADGIIGPATWSLMKPIIVSGTSQAPQPVTSPGRADDSSLESELDSNPNIKARYQNVQAYRKVRDSVAGWGISSPATYIETSIVEWNSNTGIHVHFDRNFDGDPHRSYLNLKRLYQAKGISDPAGYFSSNIVSITFFNRKTPGHKELKTALDAAQSALTSSGNNYNLSSAWSFVPRTFNNSIGKLSNHALGKAIDINPSTNPHILSSDEILVISAVCKPVMPAGLLRESNPDSLFNASTYFKNNFNDNWINQQSSDIMNAAKRKRATLNKYALNGFMTLPTALIRALQNAGLNWGGSWTSAKDFMHFELRNP